MSRDLDFYRTGTDRGRGRLAIIVEQHDDAHAELESLRETAMSLERVQALVQRTAQETQEQLRYHIEDIVQLAIDTCFPDRYEFRLIFEVKRGKTEARLALLDEGHEISPMDSSGGGVVDITAFALRIAGWTLGRTRNTVVLDEPFRFLSRELRPRAAEIVRELSRRLGIQFILVTHTEEQITESDRVFHVASVRGRSTTRVEGAQG